MRRPHILPLQDGSYVEIPHDLTTRIDDVALVEAARRTDRFIMRITFAILGPWLCWFAWQVFQGLAAKGMLPWQG